MTDNTVHNVTDLPETPDPRRTRIRTAAAAAAVVLIGAFAVKAYRSKGENDESAVTV